MENNEQNEQQQIAVQGFPVTSPINPIFGENQPAYLYVMGIAHSPLDKVEKLEVIVFGQNKQPIQSGNMVIAGTDYESINREDPYYQYSYVCGKLSLTLVLGAE